MSSALRNDVWLAVIESRLRAGDGRRRIVDFADELEIYIDEYSSRCERCRLCLSPHRCASIMAFYRAHREVIETALLLACANLSRHRVPCSIYPGLLLHELMRDVVGRPVETPSTKLLARVREAEPPAWDAFAAAMRELGIGPSHGSSWPSLQAAASTLRELDALRSTWARIADEIKREQGRDSWYRKDPAHRRAQGWLDLCRWVLSGLAATPDGPLRLFVDYMFGLLSYVDARSREANAANHARAACDVLVLEVFAVVYSFADATGLDDVGRRLTLGTHGHDGCGLRKRVQRARLNSLLRGRCAVRPRVSDELWVAWLRPRLASIARVG